jgi:secondary thiamine-phosphate synthase enzyme
MKIINNTIKFKSEDYIKFKDLTSEVTKLVEDSGIKNGNVLVYSTHTTLAICVNESEKGIFKDFKGLMEKLVPKNVYYQHNDLTIRTENLVCTPGASDCLNGHSHCTHLLMRNSETIPIIEEKMALGTWQRIFAIELDCARNREVIVQIIGE